MAKSTKKRKPPSRPNTAAQAKVAEARAAAKAKKAKQQAILIGVGVTAIVVGIIAAITFTGSEPLTGVTDAAAWDLPALDPDADDDGDGEPDRVALAEFEGKPLVVNFFASWCVSCENELPRFSAVADKFEDDLNIAFVNSNETGDWRPMAGHGGIAERTLIQDIGGSRSNGLYRSLGGTGGMPITAFYNPDGSLAQVIQGELSTEALDQVLDDFFDLA